MFTFFILTFSLSLSLTLLHFLLCLYLNFYYYYYLISFGQIDVHYTSTQSKMGIVTIWHDSNRPNATEFNSIFWIVTIVNCLSLSLDFFSFICQLSLFYFLIYPKCCLNFRSNVSVAPFSLSRYHAIFFIFSCIFVCQWFVFLSFFMENRRQFITFHALHS